tara:strand:- start:2042 stop:4462 length:2421 start_codon:yes stop_codon:yes gene_type:complete
MKKFFLFCFIFLGLFNLRAEAQNYFIYGQVRDSLTALPIAQAEIYTPTGKLLSVSNDSGDFQFYTDKNTLNIFVFTSKYKVYKKQIRIEKSTVLDILLSPLSITLNEVEVNEKKKEAFALTKLDDVVGTSIYAGKKTEVVLIDKNTSGLALNNARQIYRQVAGLNIYQNDDAGLQLNIGGRGLDPNRTANFNTRQNGYDISADVLGYPESYYTPPAEALERVKIVRGAASLQYGTQFGGLINFILKSPSQVKGNKYTIRTTTGSNGLFSNFISLDGANKDVSYYSFINYKKGDGFRENSYFESKNGYLHLTKKINNKLKASFELTILDYLAKQAGGLNDQMFLEDPLQSNRTRNWFKVNWFLYNLKLEYAPAENTLHTLSLFGLDAERFALGYRSNRVAQADPMIERDLIYGEFNNLGLEYRILYKKEIKNIKTANLLGVKLYKSNNTSKQGPGSNGSDADFNFYENLFPYYKNQSSYKYPNLNTAFFGEHIIYLNKKLSITPGFRYERIETKSDGNYLVVFVDNANNPITNTTIYNTSNNSRDFILLGLGVSYKRKETSELYGNISQNYRSVTFSDISIVNPAYIINPNIEDEKGYTADLGIRGNIRNRFSYNMNIFYLLYKKRIGFVQKVVDGNVKSERGNVGDARISGIESLLDLKILNILPIDFKCNYYINTSFITSKYIKSEQNGITGNTVEFIPKINLKTGLTFKYKSIISNIQYTYLSEQYTDATNAVEANLSGVIGQIPEYEVFDASLSYENEDYKLEAGINNLLNKSYFTRRATGYPGPGIIPSPPRNYYLTLELRL